MVLTKLSALFLILVVTTCFAKIRIKTTEPKYTSHYIEATVNILTSRCENWGHAIVIAGDLPENFFKTLTSRQLVPIVLLPAPLSFMTRYFRPLDNRLHRLQNFVVMAPSLKQVLSNIQQMKELPWWNHMGSFLIVTWPLNAGGTCKNVPRILFAVWRQNLLNANVICYNSVMRKIVIYGHNPYTNSAPTPWQLVNTWSVGERNRWSLFYRIYETDGDICYNLKFDKTKDLGGHEIRYYMFTNSRELMHSYDKNEWSNPVFSPIMEYLNGTGTIKMRMLDYSSRSAYADLQSEHSDICLNPTEQYSNGLPAIYPFIRRKLYIITQYPGHKTQLQKILGVVDLNSQLGVYSVLFITVLFFKFVVHQGLVSSILNVVRIVCSTGFENIPRHLAVRLYLTSLLLFAVTMQGIYQGQLASLLTSNISLPIVNSLQDLAESNHTIYGFSTFSGYFNNPKFDGRYINLHGPNCTKYVLRDPWAACIHYDEEHLLDDAKAFKFHLSTEHIAMLHITWLVRQNWPLKETFDKIGMLLFDTDTVDLFESRINTVTPADFMVDDYVKRNKSIRVITLTDLRFAFVILFIGLTFSSIIFLVEIAIARYRSPRLTTVAVQFLT